MFSNSSLRSPIYHSTLLSFCQLTSRFTGAKAFKTKWEVVSPAEPRSSSSSTDRPDQTWRWWRGCRRPGRGAGWTMAELVNWPVHTTHSTAVVLVLDGQTLLLQHLQAVDHLHALACDHSLAVLTDPQCLYKLRRLKQDWIKGSRFGNCKSFAFYGTVQLRS